jgi:putative hydrolase of the HAD superfamily
MPGADAKGVLLDVGGVLLPTPWELLAGFEARNGWPPGTLGWRGPLDPATDPPWRTVQAGELTARAYFDFLSREVVGRSDFLGSFDVLLDESETGVAKPDPRAYDQAAAAMGLDPAAIVFVDDDPANVAGADAAGMAGVHFDVADPAGSFDRVRRRLGL